MKSKLEGSAELITGSLTSKSATDTDFEKGKEYEYVSVGLGKEDDFKDLDLFSEVALIQRGEIPFTEKDCRYPPSWCSRGHGLQ